MNLLEFAENVKKIIDNHYNKYIFGGDNDLTDEQKDSIIDFSDDILYDIDILIEEISSKNEV